MEPYNILRDNSGNYHVIDADISFNTPDHGGDIEFENSLSQANNTSGKSAAQNLLSRLWGHAKRLFGKMSEDDIDKTFMHEIVSHKGLRGLLGEERFNVLMKDVWNNVMTQEDKDYYKAYNSHLKDKTKEEQQIAAADEFVAHFAESLNPDRQETVWEKIVSYIRKALRDIGFNVRLNTEDLTELLRESLQNYEDSQNESTSDDVRFSKTFMNNLSKANEQFNKDLLSLNETNADGTVLWLGRPSPVLQVAGVEDRPLKLYGNKVIAKARKHGFSLDELVNLPNAVASPIAVFDNKGIKGNRSILTELTTTDGNFLVTVSIGKNMDVDFDIVSSVYGKREDSILQWIETGKARYIDKEKALNYLRRSAPIAETSESSRLDSVVKIINDFENPNIQFRRTGSAENFEEAVDPFYERFRRAFTQDEIADMKTPILKSKGTFKNLAEAETWAKSNLQGKEYKNKFTNDIISISGRSISEILSEKSTEKSSVKAQMSALMSVPDFIENGIPAEVHRDYHGRDFDILRLYNAIKIDGDIYRVKSTVKRLRGGDRYYTYELQEMEVMQGTQQNTAVGLDSNPVPSYMNSISGANLLKGVKKTNSDSLILEGSDSPLFRRTSSRITYSELTDDVATTLSQLGVTEEQFDTASAEFQHKLINCLI